MLDDLIIWFEERRGWVLAAVAAVAILILVVVSNGAGRDTRTPPSSPTLSLSTAAERTASYPGARVSVQGKLEGGGVTATIFKGEGAYNRETGRSSLSMHGVAGSPIPASYEYHQVTQDRGGELTSYLRSSEAAGLPAGTHWLKVDHESGVSAQSLDTVGQLGMLRSATKYFNLGIDRIRGVDTRHVRAIIDLKREARLLRDEGRRGAANALEVLIAASGGKARRYEMEAWVGGDMTIHRYRLEVMCPADRVPSSRMAYIVDLYDFGTTPSVSLPDDADVYGSPPSGLIGRVAA